LRSAPIHPHLHSFPTRRSSDLLARVATSDVARNTKAANPARTAHLGYKGCAVCVANNFKYIRVASCADTCRAAAQHAARAAGLRSEEHTSELQSQSKLVCRLLL